MMFFLVVSLQSPSKEFAFHIVGMRPSVLSKYLGHTSLASHLNCVALVPHLEAFWQNVCIAGPKHYRQCLGTTDMGLCSTLTWHLACNGWQLSVNTFREVLNSFQTILVVELPLRTGAHRDVCIECCASFSQRVTLEATHTCPKFPWTVWVVS